MGNTIKNFLFGGAGATTRFGDIGLFILRAGTGILMAYSHGWSKIYSDGSFGLSSGLVSNVKAMNFPAPTAFAWMAALTEFLGGILLAAGLMTRPIAFALTFNMAVAAFVVHGSDKLAVKELALLYLFAFQVFIFTGAGRYSLDKIFRKTSAAARA